MAQRLLNPDEFRARVASLRTAKGLGQEELTEKVDRASNYLSRVERGETTAVPYEVVAKLALALDVSIDDLVFAEGLTDSPQEIKSRITRWMDTLSVEQLKEYYRILLIIAERK